MEKLSFNKIIELAEKKLLNAAKFNFGIEGLKRTESSIYKASSVVGKNLFITPSVPKLVETKYGKRYCFQISGCETKIWMPLQNVMVVGLDSPESKVFLIHCTDKQMDIFAKAKNNPIDWTTKITQDNIDRLFFDRKNALKIPVIDLDIEELQKQEEDIKKFYLLDQVAKEKKFEYTTELDKRQQEYLDKFNEFKNMTVEDKRKDIAKSIAKLETQALLPILMINNINANDVFKYGEYVTSEENIEYYESQLRKENATANLVNLLTMYKQAPQNETRDFALDTTKKLEIYSSEPEVQKLWLEKKKETERLFKKDESFGMER